MLSITGLQKSKMQGLGKARIVHLHLYPGVLITLGFIVLAPLSLQFGFPPQLGLLLSVVFVAIPLLLLHLRQVQKAEQAPRLLDIMGFKNKLSTGRLIGYSLLIVVFMFMVWGITQPLDQVITKKLFNWLPHWYTTQDFGGYAKSKILITLVLNLLVNGLVAPVVEELYFRGYLLARMNIWGKWAVVANTILFSLYHFWQPNVYLTLILSLLPMIYVVWKTKDLRLAILTHCLLNIIGALLSFGLVFKS